MPLKFKITEPDTSKGSSSKRRLSHISGDLASAGRLPGKYGAAKLPPNGAVRLCSGVSGSFIRSHSPSKDIILGRTNSGRG